jgi:hypothetical protein
MINADEVDDVVAEFLIDRKKHRFLISSKAMEFVKVNLVSRMLLI